jgi:hypothetical protein
MTSHSTHSAGTSFGESELRSVMESLLYLTEKFFESRVICADPGGTCNRIADTIHFLRRNFQREEQMMDVVGYPEAAPHKKEHKDLLRKLIKLKRTLVCSGYDNAMLFDLITDWKMNHVPRFDEPFGRYLHEFETNSTRVKGM